MADINLKEAVKKLRDAGVSEEKIRAKLQTLPQYKDLLTKGVSEDKVLSRLGFAIGPMGQFEQVTVPGAPTPAGKESVADSDPTLGENARDLAGRIPAGIVKGAVESTIGLPGLASQLIDKVTPEQSHPYFQKALDYAMTGLPGAIWGDHVVANYFPNPTSLESHLNAMGLDAGPPQGRVQEYADSISRGAGAGLATAPLGGLGFIAGALAGAASGGASQVAHELFPDSELAPIVGGLIGGIPMGGTMGIFAKRAINRIVKGAEGDMALKGAMIDSASGALDTVRNSHKDLLAEKEAAGLAHRGDMTTAQEAHDAFVASAKINAEKQITTIEQPAKDAIGRVANNTGTAASAQEVGEALQSSSRKWLGDMNNKQGAIWEPIDSNVPPTLDVGLPTFKRALDDINSKAGTLEPLNALLKPALPQTMSRVLTRVKEGAEEGMIAPPTYADVRTLRTTLGKALSDPKILNSVGDSNLKQLYGALTQDIRGALKPIGLDQEFDAANAASTHLYDFAENTVGKIVKSVKEDGSSIDPEVIGNRIMALGAKGGTLLANLRQHMPEAVNEMASYMLRTPGKWDKLAPEAKEALIPDAPTRGVLDASHAALATGRLPVEQATNSAIEGGAAHLAQLKKLHQTEMLQHDLKIHASKSALRDAEDQVKIVKDLGGNAEAALERAKKLQERRELPSIKVPDMLASLVSTQAGGILAHAMALPPTAAATLQLGLGSLPLIKGVGNYLYRNPNLLAEPLRGAYLAGQSRNGE